MVALSIGDAITAADTIAITHDVHHIVGNTGINTITPPSPSFCGFVVLIADSGSAGVGTSGNIAWSGALGQNEANIFFYDPGTSKWYPRAGN